MRVATVARREAWDEAHGAWLQGADPAEVGAGLPGCAPLALRALDALERDDEPGARALLDEALEEGATGVATALSLALGVDEPGRVRAGSVVLDGLAEGVRKWLAGTNPRGSKALQVAARQRALAGSVRTMLAKRGSRTLSLPAGIQDWPRARALILALWGARLDGRHGAERVLAGSPVGDELDLDRYAGLDAASSAAPPRDLESWLTGGAWSDRTERAMEGLTQRAPRDGDPLLARIVDRLRADLTAGRLAPALEAVPLVAELACRLDHHDLEEDVRRLEGRLRWAASGTLAPGSLAQLWCIAGEAGEPPRAQVELARQLIEVDVGEGALAEAVLCLLRWDRFDPIRTRAVTVAPPLVTAGQVREALAGRDDLPPGEAAWLLGLLAVRRGDAEQALARGVELLESGVRPDRACDLLLSAWPRVTRRGAKRRLLTAGRRSIAALAGVEAVDLETAHRLGASLELLCRGLRSQRSRVQEVALASIPGELSVDDPHAGHAVALRARLLGLEAARPLLRRLGRTLRALPPAQADVLALRTLACLLQWEQVPPTGDLAAAVRPLEAWLDQAGVDRLLAAAQAVAARPVVAHAWLALWLQEQDDGLGFAETRRLERLTRQLVAGARAVAEGLAEQLVGRIEAEDLLCPVSAEVGYPFDFDDGPCWDLDDVPIPF